jgi:hypothetical protein
MGFHTDVLFKLLRSRKSDADSDLRALTVAWSSIARSIRLLILGSSPPRTAPQRLSIFADLQKLHAKLIVVLTWASSCFFTRVLKQCRGQY